MDNFVFLAMSGAKENMLEQQLHMNNLANASTTGFRADFAAARSQPVLGDGGPVTIPPARKIDITADGTISIVPENSENNATAVVGRLKLVKPDLNNMIKNEFGLLVQNNGQPAETDATVKLVTGAVESSNVNPIGEMVNMISLSRQYEMQVKLMKKAEEMDRSSSQLLRLQG